MASFHEQAGPWGEVVHAHHGPTGLLLDARLQVTLPPSCRLWEFQSGFRWSGTPPVRLEDWKEEWLLIADAGGDPFIRDMPTGHVLFARHGAGSRAGRAGRGRRMVNRGRTVANLESLLRVDDALVAQANGNFAIFRPRPAQP